MLTTAYALDKKTQIFPSKGIHGYCLDCGKEVISKCGTLVAHHFAHSVDSNCGSQFHDHKTEWHQLWQHTVSPSIPGVNVEVPISIDKTVKRADLISHAGIVVEFQHSPLSIVERMDREAHYKNMLWVVHTNKENSKTWKRPISNIRIFFNGDDDRVRWKSYQYGRNVQTFEIKKDRFIRMVINNPKYTDDLFDITEVRYLNNRIATFEYYDRIVDEREAIITINAGRLYPRLQLRSKYYTAVLYLINEFESIERYHVQQHADRLELKRQEEVYQRYRLQRIKENEYEIKKEQRKVRDPAFLLLLLQSESESIEETFTAEKNLWVATVERELFERNKKRREEQLKIERERELELLNKINTEICSNNAQQLNKEMQERIRIDLIRIHGNIPYAAEAARERLKRLGIDYNNVAYGSDS